MVGEGAECGEKKGGRREGRKGRSARTIQDCREGGDREERGREEVVGEEQYIPGQGAGVRTYADTAAATITLASGHPST